VNSKLIYGKDNTEGIVGIEVGDSDVELFKADGTVEVRPFNRYILHKRMPKTGTVGRLEGSQAFRFFTKYDTKEEYYTAKRSLNYKDVFTPRNDAMAVMLKDGITMYKGMKMEDVSVLSFDIETSGLVHDSSSTVYIISTTFLLKGELIREIFTLDKYSSQGEMIDEFCNYVRRINPDLLVGHNILGFDLPYLQHCASGGLNLGRDGSKALFAKTSRQFRKDGSQSYDYKNCQVYGREVVDTFMLSIKYDLGRKYPSYRLKEIIAYEGLEVKNRIKWDFDKVTAEEAYNDRGEKWENFKKYCVFDSDDAISLVRLMLPSFFYYCQTVPMSLQEVILTASGSQVNAIMVRSYLQCRGSIPEASAAEEYEGAISFGNPGVYKHVNKVDVASLYPSIIISDRISDTKKDPKGNFLKIVETLTKERLENKRLAKETGDRYYKDIEQAQKIIINSAYGFMGATGLHFNYPKGAAKTTERGREILRDGIRWAESKGFQIVNVDTDSFSYTTGKKLPTDEFESQISEINGQAAEGIVWEDDGQYKTVVVVKAKNYVLEPYKGDYTIKGSSLKATMKEPALRDFIEDIINALLKGKKDEIIEIYDRYALEIYNITDISRWASKKTITKSVLHPERTNEQRILDAVGTKKVSEGDKIHVFFDTAESLCLVENFNGTYCSDTLFGKLFNSMKIFATLIDVDMIPNYKLKRNKARIITKGELHESYSNSDNDVDKYAVFREDIKTIQSPYTRTESALARMRLYKSEDDKNVYDGNNAAKKRD